MRSSEWQWLALEFCAKEQERLFLVLGSSSLKKASQSKLHWLFLCHSLRVIHSASMDKRCYLLKEYRKHTKYETHDTHKIGGKSLPQTGLIHKDNEKRRKDAPGSLALVLSNSLCSVEAVVLSSQVDYLKPLGSTPLLTLMGSTTSTCSTASVKMH